MLYLDNCSLIKCEIPATSLDPFTGHLCGPCTLEPGTIVAGAADAIRRAEASGATTVDLRTRTANVIGTVRVNLATLRAALY